jgi:prefoldin subunit 5
MWYLFYFACFPFCSKSSIFEESSFPYISVMSSLLQLLGVLAQVKIDRDAVEALLQPTDAIDRLFREIQQLSGEVEDLEYKLDSCGQGVKSLEEIQQELNSVQRTRYLI